MVRLQLILFSQRTGTFLFRTFGGFLLVPTTQIYCLTGAIISETPYNNNTVLIINTARSSTSASIFFINLPSLVLEKQLDIVPFKEEITKSLRLIVPSSRDLH
jgi:hypothetical protein